jgi:hypothetical protein
LIWWRDVLRSEDAIEIAEDLYDDYPTIIKALEFEFYIIWLTVNFSLSFEEKDKRSSISSYLTLSNWEEVVYFGVWDETMSFKFY